MRSRKRFATPSDSCDSEDQHGRCRPHWRHQCCAAPLGVGGAFLGVIAPLAGFYTFASGALFGGIFVAFGLAGVGFAAIALPSLVCALLFALPDRPAASGSPA